jgi:hypothetical protein
VSARDPSGRDLPLLQWGEALRRDAADRARLRRRALLWFAGFWAIALDIAFPPSPRLVWNASASAPVGLYRVSPGTVPEAGKMVAAWVPGVPVIWRRYGTTSPRMCPW